MESKIKIRERIKNIFVSIKKEERKLYDTKITQKILQDFSLSKDICIYESMSDEVSTGEIIDFFLQKGKCVYVPKVISETKMILIDYLSKEEYIGKIDVFFIPGRAFSIDGKRLGRGKGYYDRFLSQKIYKNSKKVGICYDFQTLNDIPIEKHDILMDIIISEKTGKK